MWNNQKWYQLLEGVILIARCVHFDTWNKIEKKKISRPPKSRGGGYEIFFFREILWKKFWKFFFSHFIPDIKMFNYKVFFFNTPFSFPSHFGFFIWRKNSSQNEAKKSAKNSSRAGAKIELGLTKLLSHDTHILDGMKIEIGMTKLF